MHDYPAAKTIKSLIEGADNIVIIQADNPDADSLGSALALEHILGDLGKKPYLYCGVDIPAYLRYLEGWDRVSPELPNKFDLSIIVDVSTMTLLEKVVETGLKGILASKPCVVLDHHAVVEHPISFATESIVDPGSASAGQLIYTLAKAYGWPISVTAQTYLMSSILGDTQGLSNDLTSAMTYRVMAEFVEAGVNRPRLEELRREYGKMPQVIFKYKAALIAHTDFSDDGTIASVMVPQVEINQYSPLYNPGPLVQNDMLQTSGVKVAIVFKRYDDGKVTGAIRCNPGSPIAAQLADHFGGGGHAYASGFKLVTSRPFNEIKSECYEYATKLLNNLKDTDETV